MALKSQIKVTGLCIIDNVLLDSGAVRRPLVTVHGNLPKEAVHQKKSYLAVFEKLIFLVIT